MDEFYTREEAEFRLAPGCWNCQYNQPYADKTAHQCQVIRENIWDNAGNLIQNTRRVPKHWHDSICRFWREDEE
jgi:hypothetical protein